VTLYQSSSHPSSFSFTLKSNFSFIYLLCQFHFPIIFVNSNDHSHFLFFLGCSTLVELNVSLSHYPHSKSAQLAPLDTIQSLFHTSTMHFNALVIIIHTVASILVLTDAIPIIADSNKPLRTTCQGASIYLSAGDCSSGFVGCLPIDNDSYTYACAGKRRFHNDCGLEGDLGTFHTCSDDNGFTGCTTDVFVCDKKPAADIVDRNSSEESTNGRTTTSTVTTCPPHTLYVSANDCPSGFVGCVAPADFSSCCFDSSLVSGKGNHCEVAVSDSQYAVQHFAERIANYTMNNQSMF